MRRRRAIERPQALAGDPRDHFGVAVADRQVQVPLQGSKVDAFGETQAGEDSLPQVLLRRDALGRSVTDAGALHALHVPLRRAVVGESHAAAALAQEAAGAAARRRVLPAAPVERVVDRLLAFARVIADLVSRVPALGELRADRIAHVRDRLVVRKRELAAAQGLRHRDLFRQSRQREGVAGDVLGAERDGGGGVASGQVFRLPLNAVDQIQRDVAEARCARGLECAHRVAAAVLAPESDQLRRRERLHADREPVDAQLPERGEPLLVGGARIRLEGDLGVRPDRPERTDLAEHAAELRRIPERGRAPAEIDGDGLAAVELRRPRAKLAQDRVGITLLRDHRLGARGEVAVRTLRQTVGEVDVDAELHQSSWSFARSVSRCASATQACSAGQAQMVSQ